MACKPEDYKHNLSLFVACLTKQVLVEPFNVAPQAPTNTWHEFEKSYTTDDINRDVKLKILEEARTPPYKIEISSDFKEYIAFQEIPLFGAHFYYAFTPNERIHKWQKFNKLRVPQNFLNALKISDAPESPMKGRISRKPHERVKKAKAKEDKPVKTPVKVGKPQWEGGVEEEPEPVPEPKKTAITIPTDGIPKNIPAALQRRMAEAERQSKFEIFFLDFFD
jgi:hypothetical protein